MELQKTLVALFSALFLLLGNVALADNEVMATDVVTVNINTADAKSMAKVLKGIGLSRAEAIVSWREKNGKFFSAEELSQVRGIGKGTVEKNADRIVVK